MFTNPKSPFYNRPHRQCVTYVTHPQTGPTLSFLHHRDEAKRSRRKQKMKTKTMTIITAVSALAIAAASNAQTLNSSTSVEFFPKKSRYARGEVITAVVTVRGIFANGASIPLPNTPVQVGDAWGEANWSVATWMRTNGNGQVTFNYRIPTNPHWDNIHLGGTAVPPMPFRYSYAFKRIPIGQ